MIDAERDEEALVAPAPRTPSTVPRPFDLTGEELPSGRKAKARNMTAGAKRAVQVALQSKDPVIIADHWSDLLLGATDSLDGKPPTRADIEALWEVDRKALLLRIGFRSFPTRGLNFRLKWTCSPPYVDPGCGVENPAVINMGKITWTPVEDTKEFPLPGGKIAKLPLVTGRAAVVYLRMRKGDDRVDSIALMVARGLTIDGNVAEEATIAALLPEELAAIEARFPIVGGVDSEVGFRCAGCGKKWSSDLEWIPGFFLGPGCT